MSKHTMVIPFPGARPRPRATALCWLGLLVAACVSPTPTTTAPVAGAQTVTAAMLAAEPPPGSFLSIAQPSPGPATPPIELTASDGTGLVLTRLDARSVVQAPLVFTELRLTFDNPEDREREGRFSITLPQGAAISRFAMRIGERWQEGEVLEKQRAREAYEDFLHRKQDPALLEQAAGNQFRARVFPIPARGQKELIVSYSQVLTADSQPVVPLAGLPQLEEVSVSAASGGELHGFRRAAHRPTADVSIDQRRLPSTGGLRAGDLVLMRVRPLGSSRPAPLGAALLLVDTSASRALGLESQLALVKAIASQMDPATPLTVACFDQDVVGVFDGVAGDLGAAVFDAVRTRGALGASDLSRALAYAAKKTVERGLSRVVLLSDGVPTAGETKSKALGEAVAALAASGVRRFDAVAVGGIRDDALLARLTTAGLSQTGVVTPGDGGAATVVAHLGGEIRSATRVSVPGARWHWPQELSGVVPGQDVVVFAELPEGAEPRLLLDGAAQPLGTIETGNRPLVERAWARARIASLLEEEGRQGESEERTRQIVALSTRHRVLSPHTALLVLETEEDYQRYGIERRALGDILTVVDGQLATATRGPLPDAPPPAPEADTDDDEAKKKDAAADSAEPPAEPAVSRSPLAPPPPPPPPPAPAPETAAAPGDPLQAGGYGVGHGHAGRASRAAPPRVRMGAVRREPPAVDAPAPEPPRQDPYEGKLAEVMHALSAGDHAGALQRARSWHASTPGDVLSLVALGTTLEATGDPGGAARAYGSIVDLYASRADLRRYAGNRLERLGGDSALALAVDTYRKAREQRPDHPSSHRLLAFALVRQGAHEEAFEVLEAGLKRSYPEGRFEGVERILREDLGLVAAAWAKAAPGQRAAIDRRLRAAGGTAETAPSLRFVLYWETDANDVDFHIHDDRGGHAYYSEPKLPSGGELYADVTNGYGPECFTVRLGPGPRPKSYRLEAHYYSKGPMGYGMGKLQIVEHDGRGGLHFEDRPFVVMTDGAFVPLGAVAPAAR